MTPDTNSLTFLAAHLTESRHCTCTTVGRPLANPLEGRLKGKTLDDIGTLPSLAEIVSSWDAVSAHLEALLRELTTEDLAREALAASRESRVASHERAPPGHLLATRDS